MLDLKTHIVTLKLLTANGISGLDYLKEHFLDVNAWEAFFSLSELNHNDLLLETLGVLPKPIIVDISVRFAESVLPIYERRFPNDNRPREAINAAKNYIANPCDETANAAAYDAYDANAAADAAYAAYAAYAAADAAVHAAADAAADAAVHAAADAALAAADAYAADAYANAADAYANAADAYTDAAALAADAYTDRNDFEKQQIEIVLTAIQEYSHKRLFANSNQF